jgi:hypothetical protein
MSPAQRILRARIAANVRLAQSDPHELTRAANRANRDRELDRVDPERKLPEAERERRAAALRRAEMHRLALRSSQIRAARKAGSK